MNDLLNKIQQKVGDSKSPTFPIKPNTNKQDEISTSILKGLSRKGTDLFSIDKDIYDKTLKRDKVLITKYMDEEELNKAKAENQGALEQLCRAVTQAVGNEVVLGTLLGFSNIVDFFANIGREEGLDDYTNPVSTQLENWQNQLRDRFEIYQKDPNASWAIGDFGWWTNNMVSIASSASMLLPSTGIVKGFGLLGKIGKGSKTIGSFINKGALLMGNAAKAAGIGKSAIRNYQAIKSGTEIGLTALASRTMEGYLEARGVYNEIKDDTVSKLSSMSDEEFSNFIKANPNFKNKSIDEIASHIASISADETFANDYAMLLMDVVQLKALGSMWKGLPNKTPSAALRLENKKAIKSLLDDVVEDGKKVAKKQGWSTTRLERIKETLRHPLTTVGAIEWSEGIEEGYQGIQTEKGKEVAKMIFDPNYTPRTIESYLADPAIWEQAFWGVLGGVGFQAIGTGLGNAYRRIDAKINKDKYANDNIDHLLTTEEKVRKAEIEGRKAKLDKFVKDIELIQSGYSPDEYEIDTNTGQYVIEDGVKKFKRLTKEEQEAKKIKLVNDLLTDMTFNAVNSGNLDLFTDFISSEEFNQYLKKAGINSTIEDKQFDQYMKDKINHIGDIYATNLYKVLSNTEVEHDSIARLLAANLTREKLTNEEYDLRIADVDEKINKLNTGDLSAIDAYKYLATSSFIDNALEEQKELEEFIEKLYNNKKISLQAREQYQQEINETVHALETYRNSLISVPNDTPAAISNDIKDLVNKLISYETQKAILEEINPKSNNDYIKRAKAIEQAMQRQVRVALDAASEKVENWIKQQKDLDDARNNLYANNAPELRKELDMLMLGHRDYADYTKMIEATIKEEKQKRNKESQPVVNGNVAPQAVVAQAQQQQQDLEDSATDVEQQTNTEQEQQTNTTNEETETSPSSTGEVTEDKPAVVKDDNINDTVVEAKVYSKTINLFKDNYEYFNNPTEESNKVIMSLIEEELINEGYYSENLKEIVLKGYKSALNFIRKRLEATNNNKLETIETLISSIDTKSSLEINNDTRNAITKLLTKNELDKVIDDLLKKYIEEQQIVVTNGKKTVINLKKLFRTLINDYNVDIDTAMHVLFNMKEFIASTEHNYIFKEKNELNYILRNPDIFFDEVRNARTKEETLDNYMHVSAPNKRNRHHKYNETVSKLTIGDELVINSYGTFDGHHSPTTMDVTRNGVPIGYITKVNPTDDNTGYSLQLSENSTELRYVVRKNADGTIVSNTDNLFNEFIENKTLFDILNKFYILELEGDTDILPIKEEVNAILNNPIVAQAIKDGIIVFNKYQLGSLKGDVLDATKAKIILSKIKNVIFYDVEAESINDFKNSYKDWIEKLYINYENTHKIQNAVTDKGIKVKYGSMGGNINQKTTLIRTEDERPIGVLDGLYADRHPIIAISKNENGSETIVSEKSTEKEEINYTPYRLGTMGFRIGGTEANPHIILFTSSNKVNGKIKTNLSKELTSLFKDYQSKKITYEDLKDAITDLFNGHDNKGSFGKDSIFKGIDIYEKDGMLHIRERYQTEEGDSGVRLIATIHKYKKNSREESTAIYYTPNTDGSGAITSTQFNNKQLEILVNTITDKVYYNATFYTINHNKEDNHKENRYFYKENGEFVVDLGGEKTSYYNFGQFVLDNNAFNTTQGQNKNGGFYNNADKINSIYIDVAIDKTPDSEISPVEIKGKKTISIRDVITSASTTTFNSTRDLLNILGVKKDDIDFLLGNNVYNISLIADEYGYDEKKTYAEAYYKNGRIYFSNRGVTEGIYTPRNIRRLLIHESLHDRIAKVNLFERKKIIAGLLDTYNETIKALDNIIANENPNSIEYKKAKNLKDKLEINHLNPNTYFTYGSAEQVEEYNKLSQEEKDAIFAEEWLVECLSQDVLMKFLNDTKYSKGEVIVDDIKEKNKSIWQKIIDLLLKLFNINNGNIKNNTIFAQQYLLLSNDINKYNTTEEKTIVEEKTTTETSVEEEIDDDIDDEITQPEVSENKNKFNKMKSRRFSITSTIEDITDNYTEEERNILANAPRDDQGRLLAPNGKISKFVNNPKLYAQVKTKTFIDWFGDWINNHENASKVVDFNTGEPKIMYHASFVKFNKFDFDIQSTIGHSEPFGHIGTKDTADILVNKQGRKYKIPVFANIKNPLITDDFVHENISQMLNELYKRNIITIDEYKHYREINLSNAGIRKLMSDKGFDGTKYLNEIESNDNETYSYSFINADQIKIINDSDIRYSITETFDDYIEDIVNNDGNATAETFGVTRVSNMNDYINSFPIHSQLLIAKMVKNGEIKWVCR